MLVGGFATLTLLLLSFSNKQGTTPATRDALHISTILIAKNLLKTKFLIQSTVNIFGHD